MITDSFLAEVRATTQRYEDRTPEREHDRDRREDHESARREETARVRVRVRRVHPLKVSPL
jgi:hypothetical protein